MKRRSFLQLLSLGSLSPGLIKNALARENSLESNLVLIHFTGGWDTTLCLDPWTQSKKPQETDLFIEYGLFQVEKFGNMYLGPAMDPVRSFASEMSIINGVFLNEADNGHEAGIQYMFSGRAGKHNSMLLDFEDLLPTQNGLGVLTNQDIIRANSLAMINHTDGIVSAYQARLTGDQQRFLIEKQNHISPLTRALQDMVSNSPKLEHFYSSLDDVDSLSDGGQYNQAKILANAFRARLSNFAKLEVNSFAGSGLDTHSNHPGAHLSSLSSCFTVLKRIFNAFKDTPYADSGQSMFDRTTFMVTSEFSRTAALNSGKGKDHNPMTNSVLLAGHGIKGGQTIGASKLIKRKDSPMGLPYQMGMPFDFQSGQVIKERVSGSKFIQPENILATLATNLNFNLNDIPGIDSNTEVLHQVLK